MARSFVQYLAIKAIKICSIYFKICQKVKRLGSYFAKNFPSPHKGPKGFIIMPTLAKFRQIWSHCLAQESNTCSVLQRRKSFVEWSPFAAAEKLSESWRWFHHENFQKLISTSWTKCWNLRRAIFWQNFNSNAVQDSMNGLQLCHPRLANSHLKVTDQDKHN